MPELRRYLSPLFCKIKNDDLRQYGQDLALQVQRCTDEEIRQGITRKLMKETLEHLEEERDRLAKLVADGVEKRPVECVLQADYISNRAFTMRMDTGEVIDDRALKPEEMQMGLEIEMTDGPQSVAVPPQSEAPETEGSVLASESRANRRADGGMECAI